MIDAAVIYDASEAEDRWFITFRRGDGSTGDLVLDERQFRQWYESEIGRSYGQDRKAGIISAHLEGRNLRFWNEGGKAYWAME